VAVPTYQDYVTRGKIPEAVSALATDRIQMEQWFQDNHRYGTALGGAICGGARPTTNNFTITCGPNANIGATTTDVSFLITATGINGMAGFTYTVDESNNKTSTIAAPAPSAWQATNACWITKKGGVC
jgi:type IV pilus assembly protein PilE